MLQLVPGSVVSRKYYGGPDENGNPLFWGTHADGFPSQVPPEEPLTEEEILSSDTIFNCDYRCFKLPEDKKEYLEVIDRVQNGVWYIQREVTKYDEKDPSTVYCHVWWVKPYSVPSKVPFYKK